MANRDVFCCREISQDALKLVNRISSVIGSIHTSVKHGTSCQLIPHEVTTECREKQEKAFVGTRISVGAN